MRIVFCSVSCLLPLGLQFSIPGSDINFYFISGTPYSDRISGGVGNDEFEAWRSVA